MAARFLLLGGTADGLAMGRALAAQGIGALYSLAGRTADPALPPLPHRIGGFGGVAGLIALLSAGHYTGIIDATHPFAAGMSRNAHAACTALNLPLLALERPPWRPGPGDRWRGFDSFDALAQALPDRGERVFLAIGRQNLQAFAGKPGNHYLLRLVDAPDAPLPLPDVTVILGRGPFTETGDRSLMQAQGITLVVAKNAGGDAARAKLDAARALGLPVWMVERPVLPARTTVETVTEAMDWVRHHARLGV